MVNDDRVVNPDGGETVQIAVENRKKPEVEGPSSSKTGKEKELAMEEEEEANEEVPLIGNAECRICQDEDSLNNLESPCACSGSLKVNFLFSLNNLSRVLSEITSLPSQGRVAYTPPSPDPTMWITLSFFFFFLLFSRGLCC